MALATPFFRAFGPLLFGRPAQRTLRKIGRIDSLAELYEIFGHLLPDRLLAPSEEGPGSRERDFSLQVTFWAFAAQILSPGTACREIVRRVEAWRQETFGCDQRARSSSTAAFCQARARLEPATLELIRAQIAHRLERNVLSTERWAGRAVIAAAGKTPRQQARLIDQMLEFIAKDEVPERPGRSEPRAKKRRQKNYQLLTKPRAKMGNLPRRNRPKAKQPKHPKSALS